MPKTSWRRITQERDQQERERKDRRRRKRGETGEYTGHDCQSNGCCYLARSHPLWSRKKNRYYAVASRPGIVIQVADLVEAILYMANDDFLSRAIVDAWKVLPLSSC